MTSPRAVRRSPLFATTRPRSHGPPMSRSRRRAGLIAAAKIQFLEHCAVVGVSPIFTLATPTPFGVLGVILVMAACNPITRRL